TAKSISPANRYLLIVETSKTMQNRSEAVLKSLQEILATGMGGQLRSGDTLGIWTFNDELYAGKFPMQVLSPETQRTGILRALRFVSEQKYEKRARPDKVLQAMQQLIKGSDFISIILVTSGEQPMHGTPFDDPINASYKTWRDEQQKAHLPLITVLRAKKGVL